MKSGDRVRVMHILGEYEPGWPIGRLGTVTGFSRNGRYILVEMDEASEAGEQIIDLLPDELELVEVPSN